MITKKILLWGSVSAYAALTGCSFIDTEHSPESLHSVLVPQAPNTPARPSSYLRPVPVSEYLYKKKITFANANTSLMETLSVTLPEYNVVPYDAQVDLLVPVSVSVQQMPLPQFLNYLETTTGYGVEVKGSTLEVASHLTKQWNIAALASLRESEFKLGQRVSGITRENDGTEVSTGSTQVSSKSLQAFNDQWGTIEKSAKTIMGIPANLDSTATVAGDLIPEELQPKTFVTSNRSLGILLASGPPRRIRILDRYLTTLARASSQEINIDVKAFDVLLNDNRGSGIDWQALRKNHDFNLNVITPNFIGDPAVNPPTGLWSAVLNYAPSANSSITAGIRFLEQYGKVRLINEPNVTTLNGSTAYISSGDEFSFVSDFEQVQDQNGSVTVTPKFSRLKVGVTMAVTPRVLEDQRIMLDVVPVISSLQAFRKFEIKDSDGTVIFPFETPDISLQELSTQVVARNGQTIQLGGLITRKIEEALTRVPLKSKESTELLDLFFKSNTNKLQRRELVLFLTPTLIESSRWSATQN